MNAPGGTFAGHDRKFVAPSRRIAELLDDVIERVSPAELETVEIRPDVKRTSALMAKFGCGKRRLSDPR